VAKKIAGKTFSTPEEAGLAPLTDEELADARKLSPRLRNGSIALLKPTIGRRSRRSSGTTCPAPSTRAGETASTARPPGMAFYE
jgi:hypothetical protein